MAKMAVGPHVFSTKQRVRDHARSILIGQTLEVPIEGTQREFLIGLLERHPNATRKFGCGIQDVFVRINWKTEHYEDRCFWLRRVDGTETDWSYRECIYPTDHRSKLLHVCRVEIHEAIKNFRDRERERLGETAICPISQKAFVTATAHVDHVYPDTFESLIERFIADQGLVISEVEIISGRDATIRDQFADWKLAVAWRRFHAANAVLRLLPSSTNLGIGNGRS